MLKIAKFFLIGCAFGGLLCEGRPTDDTISGATLNAYRNIRDETYNQVRNGVQNTGKVGKNLVEAVGNGANFGISEIGDGIKRVENFLGETVPRHSQTLKESAYGTVGLFADHVSNAHARVQQGLQKGIEVTDEFSQFLLDEARKQMVANGETANSAVRLASTLGLQGHRVGQKTMDTTADFVQKPSEYLKPAYEQLQKTGETTYNTIGNALTNSRKYLNKFSLWGR